MKRPTRNFKYKFIIFSLILVLAFPAGIIASPSSKKAQLTRLKNQVDSINQQIEVIDEDYLQANIRLKKIVGKIYLNTKSLNKTRQKLAFSKHVLSKRVRVMYKNTDDTSLEVLLDSKTFNEMLTNLDYVSRVGQSDGRLIRKVFRLKRQIEQTRRTLKNSLATQKKLVKTIGEKKTAIKAEIQRKQQLIGGLEADLRAYAQAQERRQLQLARTFEQVDNNPDLGNIISVSPVSETPPTNAPRSEVVQIAMRYLGRPYRWAAAGPNAFDCSGLTMYVYAQVGVGLPHSSRAQSQIGQYVPRSALQPGDLVFSGSPIHHVGIYIGSGQMISAPQTGDVVKVSPLRSNYVTARRP